MVLKRFEFKDHRNSKSVQMEPNGPVLVRLYTLRDRVVVVLEIKSLRTNNATLTGPEPLLESLVTPSKEGAQFLPNMAAAHTVYLVLSNWRPQLYIPDLYLLFWIRNQITGN